MVLTTCGYPGCDTAVERGRCAAHPYPGMRSPDTRPSARERGYDAAWERRRVRYLAAHPRCRICGRPSQVPDHYPYPRRELVELGVADPDADHFLRPLCLRCHNRETATRRR